MYVFLRKFNLHPFLVHQLHSYLWYFDCFRKLNRLSDLPTLLLIATSAVISGLVPSPVVNHRDLLVLVEYFVSFLLDLVVESAKVLPLAPDSVIEQLHFYECLIDHIALLDADNHEKNSLQRLQSIQLTDSFNKVCAGFVLGELVPYGRLQIDLRQTHGPGQILTVRSHRNRGQVILYDLDLFTAVLKVVNPTEGQGRINLALSTLQIYLI